MKTDIFKLIFHHDQRLQKFIQTKETEKAHSNSSSLEDFMKPDPTYSRFYFSGTDLKHEHFGLNKLSAYKEVIGAIETAFQDLHILTSENEFSNLDEAIDSLTDGEVILLTKEKDISFDIANLHFNPNKENEENKEPLKKALESGYIILYKLNARDGFDLQMFSMKNVYRDIFYPLQKLVPDHFRFFSINGKKFNTERHFYFETWTLGRPPHGFEEVHPESVL